MKIPLIIMTLAAVAIIVLIYALTRPRLYTPEGNSQPRTLEQKLAVLEQCGLKLAHPFTVQNLLESWDRSEYEKRGWDMVIFGLAMTEEKEPWRHHCVNLWHFDTECIEDHGDYKSIAERMVSMAQGSLLLDDIKDYVDVEEGKAWLAFKFKDHSVRIDCKVQDDWVDPSIFGTFVELLKQSDPTKLYIYLDLGGQDCIIGCVSRDQFEQLKRLGIAFKPLS